VVKLGSIAFSILSLTMAIGYLNGARAYFVKEGDILSEIAQAHGTTYQQLAKTNNIADPDVIYVNQYINTNISKSTAQFTTYKATTTTVRQSVAGNSYAYGNCTFYVKNRRSDIGNHWGHAWMWLSSARNAGYATGNVPRVGAIAWNGMIPGYSPLGHVAYVEAVNGNYVTVSEMNAPYFNVVTRRTVPASTFIYIY